MFPSLQDIVPVGVIGRLYVSASVAVNCICDAEFVGAVSWVMVVVTACRTLDVKLDVVELPECVLSPA